MSALILAFSAEHFHGGAVGSGNKRCYPHASMDRRWMNVPTQWFREGVENLVAAKREKSWPGLPLDQHQCTVPLLFFLGGRKLGPVSCQLSRDACSPFILDDIQELRLSKVETSETTNVLGQKLAPTDVALEQRLPLGVNANGQRSVSPRSHAMSGIPLRPLAPFRPRHPGALFSIVSQREMPIPSGQALKAPSLPFAHSHDIIHRSPAPKLISSCICILQ